MSVEKVILVVGLSPAWQRTLRFASWQVGTVNRASDVSETASGKVVNVARVAQALGGRVRMLTVAGGYHGKRLTSVLRVEGIPGRVVKTRSDTRVCQTLMDGVMVTELVEEAGRLARDEVYAIWRGFELELDRAGVVVLTGSVPPGCGDDFYARLIERAGRRGVPVMIDAQGTQLMKAVKEKPLAVRLTMDELAAATGMRTGSARQTDRAAERLLALGAQWVVVSDGPRAVRVFSVRDRFDVRPPSVKAVNPIGSGDAMMAGMACGWVRGWPMRRAVTWGVACGSANAMTLEPGRVRKRDVNALDKLLRERKGERACLRVLSRKRAGSN